MKGGWKNGLLALGALSLHAQATAQSINPALDPHQGETRVSAAITIPLGHASDRTRSAPRLEIVSRTRAPGSTLPIVARDDERRWRERRIGFTLDGNEQLMLNGKPLALAEDQQNLDTTETILVVVGGVVLAGGIAFALWVDALTDDDD